MASEGVANARVDSKKMATFRYTSSLGKVVMATLGEGGNGV
ncbi:MAG: hypothetical protein RLY14_1104 [Planctomycetota bacterium]|jgi:hypothetical protein